MRRYLAIVAILFTGTLSAQNAGIPGACGVSGVKDPSPMNGSATLGQTYNQSDCGLNFVVANVMTQTRTQQYSFNMGGTGLPTTLTISGMPNCHTVKQAYVWYNVSYISNTPPNTTVNITNPAMQNAAVPATNIGTDQGKCWAGVGEKGTVVYRADVTANVSGNGNYVIDITGLTNKNVEVDGVTLMIIYKDNSASYQGSMVIWDGCHTGIGSNFTQAMTGVNACGASTNGTAFLLVSDMQSNVNNNQHPSTLNGNTANYPNNFYCWDQAATNVTAGQASANFGTDGLGSDCFTWSIMGLYYQTTTCTTCVPAAVTLSLTITPSTCNAPNGAASVVASGAPPPYTYTWSNGATTTAISNLTAGTYSVNVVDGTGCSATQTFTITTSVGPAVTFSSTPTSCAGGTNGTATASATGGTAPYTFGWATNPPQTGATANGLAAGTYSVLISDASGCSATYTVGVTQPTALTATASPVTNASCFGSSDGSVTASGSGGTGAYTYGWTPSGQNTQVATGLAAGTYSVIVTDANGCTAPSSTSITQPTQVTMTSTSGNASCGISDGTASVNPSGGSAPYSYLWLTSPVQSTQSISGLAAGNYIVLVTDANGCTSSANITIGGGLPPVAQYDNTPDTIDLFNATVYFTDLSTGAATWTWDFGDPNDPTGSTQQHPYHTYTAPGVYCAMLTVTDAGGVCKDSVVHCVLVESPFTFYIPNTFTPNADAWNEIFYAYGTYIKEFKIMIFDRWGNKIFESNDMRKGWDGMVQSGRSGKLVQEDVYVWKVELMDANNRPHKYIGNVNVVR